MSNERLMKVLVSDILEFQKLLRSEDDAAEQYGDGGDSPEDKGVRTADWFDGHGMPKLRAKLALMRETLNQIAADSPLADASPQVRALQAQVLWCEGMMERVSAINHEGISPAICDLRNRSAVDLFKRAFEIGRRPADALAAGRIYKEIGDRDAAMTFLKQAEELDSDGDIGIEATKLIRSLKVTSAASSTPSRAPAPSGCVIATVCLGDDRVAPLRKLRDEAIVSDPIARDFFHVFWSRYYEWSPGVARIAAADPAVARHIKWSFLDPWVAWMELAAAVGLARMEELGESDRSTILERLEDRLHAWLRELPALLESKAPADPRTVFEAFERFRTAAQGAFGIAAPRRDPTSCS